MKSYIKVDFEGNRAEVSGEHIGEEHFKSAVYVLANFAKNYGIKRSDMVQAILMGYDGTLGEAKSSVLNMRRKKVEQMQRKIKFRAWDKQNKSMEEVELLGDEVLRIKHAEWEDREDFEVMQYTGLKDKNGKEIYEGDIVDFRRGERHLYIAFNRGQWSMCQDINNPDLDYRNLDHYAHYDGPIIVIGNIHENPELLKEGE